MGEMTENRTSRSNDESRDLCALATELRSLEDLLADVESNWPGLLANLIRSAQEGQVESRCSN